MPLKRISRRTFLRGTGGIALGLPFLDAMVPALANDLPGAGTAREPRRAVLYNNGLGWYRPAFHPQQSGRNFQSSEYLQIFDPLRNHWTYLSGLSHPDQPGGHNCTPHIFTARRRDEKNVLSLDQLIAEHVGNETRHASLVMERSAMNPSSWTRTGVMVPGLSAHDAYARLFGAESKQATDQVRGQLRLGRSMLDVIRDSARTLNGQLGPADKQKMEEFFNAIREAEQKLRKEENWLDKPKPKGT